MAICATSTFVSCSSLSKPSIISKDLKVERKSSVTYKRNAYVHNEVQVPVISSTSLIPVKFAGTLRMFLLFTLWYGFNAGCKL